MTNKDVVNHSFGVFVSRKYLFFRLLVFLYLEKSVYKQPRGNCSARWMLQDAKLHSF